MAEVVALLGRQHGAQILFHLERHGALGQAEPVCNADAVRVRHDGGLFVDVADDEVRGLAADAGQLRQLLDGVRDHTAVRIAQDVAHVENIFGLRLVQATGADQLGDLLLV